MFSLHNTNTESTREDKPLDTANIPNGLTYVGKDSVLSFFIRINQDTSFVLYRSLLCIALC